MSVDPDRLLEVLLRYFPLRAGSLELGLVSSYEKQVWRNDRGYLLVAVRLTMFESADATASIDVREQEVCLGDDREHPPERWLAYVEGLLRAMPTIVAQLGDVAGLMPWDLFAYGAVLADAGLQTADDFAAALNDPARIEAMNEAAREEEWRERLEPLGLAEHAAAVRAMARPSLRLHLSRSEDEVDEDEEDDEDDGDEDEVEVDEDEIDEVDGDDGDDGDDGGEEADDDGDDGGEEAGDDACPVGQTRLGGDPDLPPDLPWPEVGGVRLTFVAQFDLAELAGHEAARELPAQGLLSFFYGTFPPGGERGDPVRVLHFTDLDALARRPTPAGVERLKAHEIELADERQYPAVESYFFYEALLPEARILEVHRRRAQRLGGELVPWGELEWFIAEANELDDPARPMHRLLGHPSSIQGDPYLDVEVDTLPQGYDGWEDGTPEALAIRRRALGWRLLLQIDATERDGLLLNQDGGFFYFWIPADALAAHDWTQARGSLQCH
ncbi:DUF1963 domain-containing protein [Nannocystis punicea]|uniref:DUF1963 domain-containing protein n=1 Tax=Nannocystis punicea TaxID=2995304 RepID=A0ABY7HGI8_9BACT|nr:DUF1963 domain-containing protein [Nannocystis poenicansa]WAS98192.1 DUF1963 domain-containing protein [Nannocystis poenicansa]